jgi:hypothetical protein
VDQVRTQQGGFPWAQTAGREQRQNRATPHLLFREIQRRYAFAGCFNLDACAEEWNTKVPRVGAARAVASAWFFDLAENGLESDWTVGGLPGRVFCNPEFEDIEPWIEKGIKEVIERCNAEQAVYLLPQRGDRAWYHTAKRYGRIEELMGRVPYATADDIDANDSSPFEASILVHLYRPLCFADLKKKR